MHSANQRDAASGAPGAPRQEEKLPLRGVCTYEVGFGVFIYFLAHSPGNEKNMEKNRRLGAFTELSWGKLRISLGLVSLSQIPVGTFFGRSILARKWLAKMTKTRQNENENFQTMTNRDDS